MGIGPWGAISNRDELDPAASSLEGRPGAGGSTSRSTSVVGAVEYTADRSSNSADGAALEPHHSHFILVDTGREGRAAWGNEIALRFAIERKVRDASPRPVPPFTPTFTPTSTPAPHPHPHPRPPTKVSDRYSVPMVLVVVEGGPNTLKTVREFLVGGCPVVLLRGSGGAADAICRCFDLLPQPPAGMGEQGAAGAGAGAEEVEDVEAEETEEAEAEEAEAKRLGLSQGDEVRATKVSVEAELDARYEAKRDDLRAIMLHAGGGRRLGRPLLFSFHCDAETEFDEQLLKAVLKGRFVAPRGKLTLAVTWNNDSVVRELLESHSCNPYASSMRPTVSRYASCSRATTQSSPRRTCS